MRCLNFRLLPSLLVLPAVAFSNAACSSGDNPDVVGAARQSRTLAVAQSVQVDGINAVETESYRAEAAGAVPVPSLHWTDCGDGFQCATAAVPLDYSRPRGRTTSIAVTRVPARNAAQRMGSMFVNFGGPGGTAVDIVQAYGALLFETLNERFDIVGFDPRGVGQSENPVDCKVNQETQGIYAQPFTTPQRLQGFVARARNYVDACLRTNTDALKYASTANVARDMDVLRAAVGDAKLTYFGFSYGTFLGTTYASLFPANYRALVLDGPIDADQYINHPSENLRSQTAAFERALDRFFQACAANQTACLGFGGSDAHAAYDNLVKQADASPIPATGDDPRPIDGDDLNWAVGNSVYAKQNWPSLAQALVAARDGDGTLIRQLSNSGYGRLDDGSFDPLLDRYFTLSAVEQRYISTDVDAYLASGLQSWGMFDHAYWNSGYSELPLGLFPIDAQGVFRGPFRASNSAPTILVVGTTYDPATPYRGAINLVSQLRNARLLTMQGDGHTAYGGNSPCIDAAVDAYVGQGALPAEGTVCQQDVPFEQLQVALARTAPDRRAALRMDPKFVRALR